VVEAALTIVRAEAVSSMSRILVTGGSGLLGSKILKAAEDGYEVISTHHTRSLFPDSIKLDITEKSEVFHVVQRFKPSTVIHTAAETNVDRCETDRALAWKVNAVGTRNVAEACGKVGAKLVFVSTDYVFDGERGLYVEEDKPNPVNYYGLSKLKGEEALIEHCRDYVIARASVLYGWHPWKTNFATWVIASLRRGNKIEVVDDHYNSPTFADNLTEVLLEMVEKDLSGTYHTAGDERISRYEFALKAAQTFGLDASLIEPTKMSELRAWVAKRPKDSSLCIDKARKGLKTRLMNVEEGLHAMKRTEQK